MILKLNTIYFNMFGENWVRNVKGKWKLNFKKCNTYKCDDKCLSTSIQLVKIGASGAQGYF